ncbi:MAG: serine/threonine-protein kinase, partial [Planctomycetota bacterium]
MSRPIGGGCSAIVYLATDKRLHRQVALKVSRYRDNESKTSNERFIREAESVAKLQHPHICQVYDVGIHEGHHYIAMNYIEGQSLAAWIESSTASQRSEKAVATIIRSVADAIQVAHDHGIIHRDLKPANILMDNDGKPVVTDFGLALSPNHGLSAKLTQPGLIVGSPAYMSPEQIHDPSGAGPQCDVYSLGIVMYQMLSGRLPFTGEVMTVIRKIALEKASPPSSHQPGISPASDHVCLKSIEKDPARRFDSMKGFADALTSIIDAPSNNAAFGFMLARAGSRLSYVKQHPFVFGLVGCMLFGLSATLANWMTGSTQPSIAAESNLELEPIAEAEGIEHPAFIGDESDRINWLNLLMESGLKLASDGESFDDPITEHPAYVDTVSTLGIAEFDVLELRRLLSILPDFGQLEVRTDDFSTEAWQILAQHGIVDLTVVADRLSSREMKIIGSMADLQRLRLDCQMLADSDLALLSGLGELKELALNHCPIDGSGLLELESLESLNTLDLTDSRIRDRNIESISIFSSLETLKLAGTPIDGSGLQSLTELQSLNYLDVSRTGVTDKTFNDVASLPLLSELVMNHMPETIDIEPLVGKPVELLDIRNTRVRYPEVLSTLDVMSLLIDDFQLGELGPLLPSTLTTINGQPLKKVRGIDPSEAASRLERLNRLCKKGVKLIRDSFGEEDEMDTPLSTMPSRVRLLEADFDGFSDSDLQELLEVAPKHEQLSLSTNWLTPRGFDVLSVYRIQSLIIEADHLNPHALESIGKMTELRSLELSCLTLEDSDLEPIGN